MMQWLFAELRRPRYRKLLLGNVLLLAGVLVLALMLVEPLRNKVLTLKEERVGLAKSVELYGRLANDMDDIAFMREKLPVLVEKQRWNGSSAEFSRAVLDAGTRAGVVLQKEMNATRKRDGITVYSKVLNFDADYGTVAAFLEEVSALEMLVVPSRVVLKPSGEALAVTLELAAFVEGRR